MSFYTLSQSEKNEHHKNVFSILATHEKTITEDAPQPIILDTAELEQIRSELYTTVKESIGESQSATEVRESLLCRFVKDGYSNEISGIGTPIDPSIYTRTSIPISITPQEASAYYAGGGIPMRIIDKKAGCMTLSGLTFESNLLSPESLSKLSEFAFSSGFSDAFRQGITQSLIFGGACVYPVFSDDSPLTFRDSLRTIKVRLRQGASLSHWAVADRWNCVFVPDYSITAKDYLYAKSLFIPLAGVSVSTSRMALIRPKKLPFWAAIQQMGWSTSDFEGWIKDFEAYQIMKMALPILAQQSSLMYHAMPADGLLLENGPEYARQYFKENEKQMREWSILHPRAINSIGEIKILERTYTGMKDLFEECKTGVSSSSGVPSSILFNEKPTGLASDNADDVALKQSEMIRLLFNNIAPSFAPCIQILTALCFGVDSEESKNSKSIRIAFDSGVVLSDVDKMTMGVQFSQGVQYLISAGFDLQSAVNIMKSFSGKTLDSVNLDDLLKADSIDTELWDSLQQNRAL